MFSVVAAEDEARARIRAFLEKRAPKVSELRT
jgi:hypothetical protein